MIEPLRRRLARQLVGRERLGGDAAGGERAVAVALQLVDRGHPALGVGQRAPGAGGAAGGDDVALGARGLRQVAGQLGAAGVLLERGHALGDLLALRPDLERLAPEPGGIAVGVHGGAVGDRLAQRGQRAARVARGQPVGGDLAGVVGSALVAIARCSVRRRSHGTSS